MLLVQEQIHAQRCTFTPAQERIADYLLDHTLEAALLTATELAQRLDVDPATVVRFAQKLRYRGYLDLKADLGRIVRAGENTVADPASSLGQALENARASLSADIKLAWEAIAGADLIQLAELLGTPCRLLLLTDEPCLNLGLWLARELRLTGFKVENPAGDPESLAVSMLAPDGYDRALILEGATPSPSLGHLSQELGRKGLRSLAVLGSASSQVVHYADVILQLPPASDSLSLPMVMLQMFNTILYALHQLRLQLQEPEQPAPEAGPTKTDPR